MALIGTLAASQTFRNSSGTSVARPNFMAYGNFGSYNHQFISGTSNSSYTGLTGFQSFPPYNNVSGSNTTGFTTSSTPGSCYYDIPLDGIYSFTFGNLVNTAIPTASNHLDAAFDVGDTSNTWRGNVPWSDQYLGQSSITYGPSGHARMHPQTSTTNIIMNQGCSTQGRFYVGQRIRPMFGMNVSATMNIYCSAHNYWVGSYLGS
jgi:hypothetical protein